VPRRWSSRREASRAAGLVRASSGALPFRNVAPPSIPPGGLVEGTTLAGKYRIDRIVGAGGMCLVYEAEHVHLRQAVALKILKPELARDPTAVARFAQEAQAAAKLRSPNVARVYDVDRLPDGQPYITMDPVDLAVDYVRQAASGISEAHALGIVHRDLKPENLFLTELGAMTERRLVKILDFGIAKNIQEGARKLTAPDAVFGTVDYMSPEQIRSASSVDHRTDIWALGVILFELLTGRTPFSGDARSIIAQIVSDPVVPPSRWVPTLPASLVSVVMRSLAKDPAARFQSAEELRRALAPFSETIEPITEVLARLPPASVPRRNLGASRPSMDGLREARTNLSFESSSPRKRAWAKQAFALPLFAALGAAAGLAVWKRDEILRLRLPRCTSRRRSRRRPRSRRWRRSRRRPRSRRWHRYRRRRPHRRRSQRSSASRRRRSRSPRRRLPPCGAPRRRSPRVRPRRLRRPLRRRRQRRPPPPLQHRRFRSASDPLPLSLQTERPACGSS